MNSTIAAPHDYRPEVDGLRAVAILAVVAQHAGLPGVGGGFLGVDVFFVISGYLITRLLVQEAERHDRIALGDFYARRMRRLLPALGTMLVATLAMTLWLGPGLDFHADVGAAAAATSLYVSNLYFLADGQRYFGAADELHPLLHTWSLGVEEQFYLVWPLALAGVLPLARRRGSDLRDALRVLAPVAGLASIVAAFNWTATDPLTAFYHPVARAWELALGTGLVAFAAPLSRLGAARGSAMAWLGALLIGGAYVAVDPGTALSGSVLAALGAAALIVGAELAPNALPARGLLAAPMVGIGLVSYGWYLWHWPLLCFGRLALPELDPLARDLASAALALLLAWLSYDWMETPIRQRRLRGFATVSGTLRIGAAITLCGAIAGAALHIGATSTLTAQDLGVRLLPACRDGATLSACTLGDARAAPRILLIGDSHAAQYLPLFDAAASTRGIAIAARTHNACPMLLAYSSRWDDADRRGCPQASAAAWAEAAQVEGLRGVVLALRWTAASGSAPLDRYERPDYERNLAQHDAATQAKALAAALGVSVASARRAGLRVLLVAPTPEFPRAVPACVAIGIGCDLARPDFERRRAAALAMLEQAAAGDPAVRVWDPAAELCDAARCAAALDGRPRYRDDDHLAAWQARALLDSARADLDWLAGD